MGSEDWKIEAKRIEARDAMIRDGISEGVDDIAEKHAKSMVHDHPGMVFPRQNRHVFAEVKACIVAAILEAVERKGCIW